ncbi:MAG: TIR domain-containing protein, partial [Leptolyngbyaceae bacterium]|nr:TIR domain-containing protein [Leptolyngbyaceae bacterium]
MSDFFDAFISYGRVDSKTFAVTLKQRLTNLGYTVWFDFNDIPFGVDFQNQINRGIDHSHNFLFIISPHSIHSAYCSKELKYALSRNKRIIPLLHVEQIDYATWKHRNPSGTDKDWKMYQEKGLHSSLEKMPSILRKINWVYFRDGQDDADRSLEGLVDIFERHKDYVHQHTHFLVKALDWEQHQKRSPLLLIGEERQQAEAWLSHRFRNEQSPCYPTDLHCEFITESTKNANNLMTQVFLAAADADYQVREKIRRSLMRENFTVWTNRTDVQKGVDVKAATRHGIEASDSVVLLLSPNALASPVCRQEIDDALRLHKRIIPLLIKQLNSQALSSMPSSLANLQFINMTQHENLADYRKEAAALVRALRQDAPYYDQHKILLVKALKWERQNENPSLLLRGYTLNHAETWLKTALKETPGRSQHGPTPLQCQFIKASLDHPAESSLDVFVSYSRADSDVARRLNEALQIQGKTTWFDQESIASGADFQHEIYRGIEQSDNFLLIVSPASITSPYCADEVNHAAKLNKRCVLVLYQPVNAADLPDALSTIQWIDFRRHGGDFYTNFSELIRTLDIDREHVRSHTKWLQRSLEWKGRDRTPDLLLRGSEFALAEAWLKDSQESKKYPPATDLQHAYIDASRVAIQAAHKKEKQQALALRSLLGAVSVVAVIAVGASIFALMSRQSAIASRQEAVAEEIEAYTATSNANFALDRRLMALLDSLKAAHLMQRSPWLTNAAYQQRVDRDDADLPQRVMNALQPAVYWAQHRHRFEEHRDAVMDVAVSPDSQRVLAGDRLGVITLWSPDGTLMHKLETNAPVLDVAYHPDGDRFAVAHTGGTFSFWEGSRSSQDMKTPVEINGHSDDVESLAFSPDGTLLFTGSRDTTVSIWSVDEIATKGAEVRPLHTVTGHDSGVRAIALSPDGQTLATATDNGNARLWRIAPDGRNSTFIQQLLKDDTVDATTHLDAINDITFSPDGRMIATASDDATIALWWSNGQFYGELTAPDVIDTVRFSPDNQIVAGGSLEAIHLWQVSGLKIDVLPFHQDYVTSVEFTPDNTALVSASEDNSIEVLDIFSPLVSQWESSGIEFGAADSEDFVTHDADGPIRRWTMDGTFVSAIPKPQGDFEQFALSPSGTMLATVAASSGAVQTWNSDGSLRATLLPDLPDDGAIALSPNGEHIATASLTTGLQLWTNEGQLVEERAIADDVHTLAFIDSETVLIGYAGGLVQ